MIRPCMLVLVAVIACSPKPQNFVPKRPATEIRIDNQGAQTARVYLIAISAPWRIATVPSNERKRTFVRPARPFTLRVTFLGSDKVWESMPYSPIEPCLELNLTYYVAGITISPCRWR